MSNTVTRTGAYGSYGAISGAKMARTSATSSMNAPTSPLLCRRNERQRGSASGATCEAASRTTVIRSLVAHPRVEPAVHQLGAEVGDHHRHGEQQERTLEDRVVTVTHRVDGQGAEARPREHGLDLD